MQDCGTQGLYRYSALASALRRMWRGWAVALPVLIANAVIQAVLIAPTLSEPASGAYQVVSVVVSAVVLLASALLVQSAAVAAVVGSAGWQPVLARVRSCWLKLAMWIVVLALLVIVGLCLNTWPGLVVPAVLAFLVTAASVGTRNPLRANFRVIWCRPVRWLITMLAIGVIAAIVWVLMVLNWFFVPSVVGAFASCLVGGWLTWWWATSLAMIYLSVKPDELA